MSSIELKTELGKTISSLINIDEATVSRSLERPKNAAHGDLAFPCFLLAKSWKLSPPQCAEKLRAELSLPKGIASAEVAGPFLNFRFDRSPFIRSVVEKILASGSRYGSGSSSSGTIIVEYSSPNIAKTFHVGHLRTTLIGNALDKILRHRGYHVISINHLGDWGTQFGFVWAGCSLWGKPANETVDALVELYRRASALKKSQEAGDLSAEEKNYPDVNEIARKYFLDLEAGEKYAQEFWQWCLDVSMEYFRATYSRFNVAFDHYTGESFYSDKLDGVKKDLEKAGVLRESQGALGVELGDHGFARIYTPDGRSLYLTRDLATAKYRAETYNFDRALYIVGAPQILHFQQIKGVLRAIGAPFADKIIHIPYGHIQGMSTRGGEFVEQNYFLDEAKSRALSAYRDQVTKRPEEIDEEGVAEVVGLGAIVYSTLSRQRMKDVEFSWDHALAFQGDSGPYLLYAYARLNGIRQKALAAGVSVTTTPNAELLTEESAYQLSRLLEQFDTTLDHVLAEYEPSYLASYALDLAAAFSRAYLDLKVVGAEPVVASARLALFEATRTVLGLSLQLLGMKLVERM